MRPSYELGFETHALKSRIKTLVANFNNILQAAKAKQSTFINLQFKFLLFRQWEVGVKTHFGEIDSIDLRKVEMQDKYHSFISA